MTRTVLAIVTAALLLAAASITAQAAPIAPPAGARAVVTSPVVRVYHHCWRGPYGHLHCRYW